jgi:signal transduction histidine kinase
LRGWINAVWLSVFVSSATDRVPVLSRDTGAAVIGAALNRGVWAIGIVSILATVPVLVEIFSRGGFSSDLPVPIAVLGVLLLLTLFKIVRPGSVAVATSVVIGGVCVYVYVFSILSAHPDLQIAAMYVLNRPALIVAITGTASARPLTAIYWGVAGYLVAEGATALACVQLGLPVVLGAGPSIAELNYLAVFGALVVVQRIQRGRLPDFAVLQGEARRRESVRQRERRAIALIHDTVLNDLAVIINGPAALDDRARDRLRADVATLARGVSGDDGSGSSSGKRSGSLDTKFHDELLAIVSDVQWRGLTVEVTGASDVVLRMTPESAAAGLGAVRACLENVLLHSGASTADIVLGATAEAATVMIIDGGGGFDLLAVPSDRLGLRSSVIERVEATGGSVRIWSTPGRGTSVLISIPLRATPIATAR